MNDAPGVIRVKDLSKAFGPMRALDGVSFEVAPGEVLAYLGPNGAGKTTTIKLLCGLLQPDAGEMMVCGLDVGREPVQVKARIGVAPDESNLYPELTCRRNLEHLGELYGLKRRPRKQKAAALLEAFDLTERAETPFRHLSRGLKRRLVLAAALVHEPEVIFLDEPTIGLDVPSARALRSLIRRLNQKGTTIFLTTHNLIEAEELSDRVLIILRGRLAASGTPSQIRQRVGRVRSLVVTLSGPAAPDSLLQACPAVRSAAAAGGGWRLEVSDVHQALSQMVSFLDRQNLKILDLTAPEASLEEAFMTILTDNAAPGGAP